VTAAVEGSLGRLGTDRIDMYWLHVWDGITPSEEIVETMAMLVRSGKVLHWGFSNVPAWVAAQCAALAPRGAGPVALQLFASLTNREAEDEHVPLARDAGMGLVAWSPLSYGLLTGKYDRATVEAGAPRAGGLPDQADTGQATDEGRQRLDGANPFGDSLFTERNWAIVEALRAVAAEAGAPMASVALAWLMGRPGGWMPLLGASAPAQVRGNAQALSLDLSAAHRARLDAVSAPEPRMPYGLSRGPMRSGAVFGGRLGAGLGRGLGGLARRQEAAQPLGLGGAEELGRRPLLLDPALVKEDHVVGHVGGEPHVVGHDDHGAPLGREALDDAHDLLLELGVERRRGLVEEERAGLHAQRARDGGALLLAARELGGPGIGLVGDADLVEVGARGRLDLGAGAAQDGEGASMTFWSTVMWAHRLKLWNTMARFVRMRVTCARSAGRRARPWPRQRTGSPENSTSPC
jgi:aryl-alcohol dehydrogenase-like predicted oxidoreductase